MSALSKLEPKDRRRERRERMASSKDRRNLVARDLHTAKYRQRTIPKRRYEDEDDRYDTDIDT